MTNTEWIRSRLEAYTNGSQTVIQDSLEKLRESEWSPEFERYMRNRLLVGCFRYGKMNDPKKADYDCISSIRRRLRLYETTGNLEHLVDIANLCLVEFVHSKHPNKHFAAIDDGEHCQLKKDT